MSRLAWRKDGSAVTFEYNQRGHRVYRVISVDAATARPGVLVAEEPKTLFCCPGKKFRHDLDDGREIVWMSEREFLDVTPPDWKTLDQMLKASSATTAASRP